MANDGIRLSIGEHVLTDQIVDWDVKFIGKYPQGVQLTASIESDPHPPPSSTQHITATTLVIRMDSRAASILLQKLGDLGRSPGWPPK